MTAAFDLPPTLRVLENGDHVAICRQCGGQVPVRVTHRKVPHKQFWVGVRFDPELGENVPTDVVQGEVALYDFAEYEAHVQVHRESA